MNDLYMLVLTMDQIKALREALTIGIKALNMTKDPRYDSRIVFLRHTMRSLEESVPITVTAREP